MTIQTTLCLAFLMALGFFGATMLVNAIFQHKTLPPEEPGWNIKIPKSIDTQGKDKN